MQQQEREQRPRPRRLESRQTHVPELQLELTEQPDRQRRPSRVGQSRHEIIRFRALVHAIESRANF